MAESNYIERDALQAALQRKKAGAANGRYTDGWNDCLMRCKSMVSCFPAADVAPVRRGHWIEENGCQICSECGEEHEWDEYRAAYCDVCGAEMEVGNG